MIWARLNQLIFVRWNVGFWVGWCYCMAHVYSDGYLWLKLVFGDCVPWREGCKRAKIMSRLATGNSPIPARSRAGWAAAEATRAGAAPPSRASPAADPSQAWSCRTGHCHQRAQDVRECLGNLWLGPDSTPARRGGVRSRARRGKASQGTMREAPATLAKPRALNQPAPSPAKRTPRSFRYRTLGKMETKSRKALKEPESLGAKAPSD